MNEDIKKKIEEAVLKVSPANRGIFSYGVHSGYSLAAEDSAEKIEMHKSVLRGAIGSLAKIVNVVGFKGEETDELPDFISKKISSLESTLKVAEEALELVGKNIRNDFHERVCGQSRGCHCSINDAEQALQTILSIRGEDKG